MQTYDMNIESKILKTACDSSPEIRSKLISKLNIDMFGAEESQEVYQRMSVLLRSGKEIPTTEILKYDEVLSEAARGLIAEPGSLRSWNDTESALDKLENYRKVRTIYNGVKSVSSILQEHNADVKSAISILDQALLSAKQNSNENSILHISANSPDTKADELVEHILTTEAPDYIPTGFKEFDAKSGGFKKKSVVALASVSGGGKSTMANQLAINQFRLGFNICIVTYEMDEEEVMARILSSISAIDHGKINLKKMLKQDKKYIRRKWIDFVQSSGKGNMFSIYCPSGEKDINELCTELKPFGYDIIYFDYINLLKPLSPKKAMWENLGETARAAKLNANNINSTVVLLCQLDDESNKIKYAKAIIHNSHLVWTWQNTDKERETGIVTINIAKARSGEVYDFYLTREFSIMHFGDYDGPPPVEEPEAKPNSAKKSNIPSMDELMGA